MNQIFSEAKRVMIYRLGSLGDTVVALPAFHLISRVFPNAFRTVLTHIPTLAKAPPLRTILGGSGLVHDYVSYPLGLRNLNQMVELKNRIRAFDPDVFVYLAAKDGMIRAIRDYLFFRFCGVKSVIGTPISPALQNHQFYTETGLYEHESARLLRCLSPLGTVDIKNWDNWNLHITREELNRAQQFLSPWQGRENFFVCCAGTKINVKDWGEQNWFFFLTALGKKFPNTGLIFIGAPEESEVSARLQATWAGPSLNLCGKITPRESAAVLEKARLFIGHDSGPMHLAAAQKVPCVAIFSARNLPGVWYPFGNSHQVIYHKTECHGCGLEICIRHSKKCIASITPDEVLKAVAAIVS